MSTVLVLKCRFIKDDQGRHSFQIYNSITGQVPFASPEWFQTAEDAKKKVDELRDNFIKSMGAKGIVINLPQPGDDPDTIMSVPTDQPAAACVLPTTAILTAMAVNKHDGSFGFVLCTDTGEVLAEPETWFATPKEAFADYKARLPAIQEKIQKAADERGIGTINFVNNLEEMEEVINQMPVVPPQPSSKAGLSAFKESAEKLFGQAGPAAIPQQPAPEQPATKEPYRPFTGKTPKTFNPTLN